MSKNLGIKLIRDLKENAVQFLAIFLMCFFAMFIMEESKEKYVPAVIHYLGQLLIALSLMFLK